ncbi:hypothetical protein LCGC14_2001930 [marine sediment metagenome]|uniref:Uncharacterized protein n=1 Tax=marine sediment metagenome TaxID=412755 RepID=A0A0F9FQM1_9ZZZZ
MMQDGQGNLIVAEQDTFSYILHTFFDDNQFKNWMQSTNHLTMVCPRKARGSKRGEENHLHEFLLMEERDDHTTNSPSRHVPADIGWKSRYNPVKNA